VLAECPATKTSEANAAGGSCLRISIFVSAGRYDSAFDQPTYDCL